MDVDGVETEICKLRMIKGDVAAQLDAVQEEIDEQRAKYDDLDEVIPLEIQDKIDELERLKNKIQTKVHGDEEKLAEAKSTRTEFRAIWQEVSDWLKGADSSITADYDGVNYQMAEVQLADHKSTFSVEKDMHEKMDRLLDLSEQLTPSLDMNDKATLKESISSMNTKVTDVSADAGKREKDLEQTVSVWNEYQDKYTAVQNYLSDAESQWQTSPDLPLVSLEQARGQLHDAQEYLSSLADHQEMVTQLNTQTQQLDRRGSPASREVVDQMLEQVLEKYSLLKAKADEKQTAMQETVDNWELYQEKAETLRTLIQAAETRLVSDDVESVSSMDLQQQLIDARSLVSTVDSSHGDLATLQRSAQSVLAQLPASEAKMSIQWDLLNIQDKYEQLQWKAKEQQRSVESEIDEREKFTAEINETVSWLQDADNDLQEPETMGLGVDQVDDKINQHEVIKHNVQMRVAQIHHEIDQQHDKYGVIDSTSLPLELQSQIEKLQGVEKQVLTDLTDKDSTLHEAKQARQEYHTTLGVVKSWLDDAENQLLEPIGSLQQQQQRHQALVSEIAVFKPKLDQLEHSAERVSTTASQQDKDLLSARIAELKARWAKLVDKRDQMEKEYQEVGELQDKLDETAKMLNGWSEYAQTTARNPLIWASTSEATDRVDEQRAIVLEGTALEDKINSLEILADELEKIVPSSDVKRKIAAIKEMFYAAQTESTQRLADLEEAVADWTECKQEVDSLTNWMDKAKSSIQISHAALSIEEELERQEKIIKEIEKHEAKVSQVLAKNEKLKNITGAQDPMEGKNLTEEISVLKEKAISRRDELKQLHAEQQKHHDDVLLVTEKIEKARAKVTDTAVRAESMDTLRSRMDNTNVADHQHQLTEAIHKQQKYQDAMHDITSHMEKLQQRLDNVDPSGASMADLKSQARENQDLSLELELLAADIRNIQNQGEELARSGSDPDGQKAIQATLKILQDRYNNLEALAHDKDKELKDTALRRQQHDQTLGRFKAGLKEFEDWLTTAKVEHSGDPVGGYDLTGLKIQVKENQNLQEELNERLQQLSDMKIECDQFAEFESPTQYEPLRFQVNRLQDSTTQFKLETIEKLERLKDALKDGEKKKKELDEFNKSRDNLAKWIEGNKPGQESPMDTTAPSSRSTEHQRQLQQKICEDLSAHLGLVDSVSKAAGRSRRHDGTRPGVDEETQDVLTPEAVDAQWKKLSRQLSDKKQQLQDAIEANKPGDFHGLPLHTFHPHHLSASSEPTSPSHLSDVRRCLTDLNSCWQKLQGQVDDKQARLEHTLHFQQLYQEALLNISGWLDDIENRLFATGSDKSTEELLKDNDTLQTELESLQRELTQMSQASQQLMIDSSTESQNLIQQTVADLHDRVRTLEEHASEQKDKLRQKEQDCKNLQTEASDIQQGLLSARQRYAVVASSNLPLEQKLAEQRKLEEEIHGYEERIRDLQADGDRIMADDPTYVGLPEMNGLQDHWQELQYDVTEKKAELERASTLQDQYEHMLQEYEEYLETAQNKLRAETLTAKDLPHLQQQFTAHQVFFADLQSHKTLLDTLAQTLDRPTQQHYQNRHTRLINLTHVVQDRAAIYGQKLERLIQDWLNFHDQFCDIQSWLGRLRKQLPKKIDENETINSIEELRKMVWDYHTVQKSLDDEKAVMYEAVDRGRQLLQNVSCPTLEAELTEFGEHWVEISNETNTELKRLQTIMDQWEQFERDAASLEDWLDSAQNRAGLLAELETVDTQNIVVLRNKMEHFLSFRKEVENQQPLKTKVSTLGNQLQRVRPSDQRLQNRVERMEDQWLQLVADLPNNEEQLHQAQMDLLPSRQALNELMLWLEGIETTVREDTGKVLLSVVDTQVMLQKYRGLKVDITNRQLTVDFVNQSSMQGSVLDLDSSRTSSHSHLNEKTEFDERLGQMNKRYQSASSDVIERLKNLEMLEVRWQEFEKNYNNIVNWFTDHEDKVDKYGRIGYEASIQQAIRESRALQDQMQLKEGEIDNIKQVGLSLVESRPGRPSPDGAQVIQDMIDELNDKWAQIDHQLYQTQGHLEDALKQWQLYNNALERCNKLLSDTEYSFNRFNVASGDINAFKALTDKLKTLQAELEASSGRLQQLTDTAGQLLKVCEPAAAQTIQKAVDDVQTRWQKLSSTLVNRIAAFEALYRNWNQYEQEFERSHAGITSVEADVDDLLLRGKEEEDVALLSTQARALQSEIDMMRKNLAQLSGLSDRLTQNMDNATIIHITSRETGLSQRLHNMQQALARFLQAMESDHTKRSRFLNAYQTVDDFLEDVDNLLGSEDPNKSAEEEHLRGRIDELKSLTTRFSHTQPDLDSLNLIGYRLPLNETDSNRLKSLNQKWYNLSSNTAERFKKMQGHLLLQQDFSEKCQEWMSFLAEVEKDLAAPIAGNCDDLQEQQKSHEIFQNEMYSRQQILHAIISEGHQMIRQGDVDDRFDFEHKLSLLEEQWQSVARRTQQRKSIIDNNLRLWQAYRDNLERLTTRLSHITEGLEGMDIQAAPLQKIRNLHNNIKSSQRDSASVEPLYHRANDSGKILQQNCDPESCQLIQDELSQLHTQWVNLIGQLENRRSQLEGILHKWDETEEGMEDMLDWLKDIRRMVMQDLPDHYDDLQRELHQCMEYETSFRTSEDRKNCLAQSQQDLLTHISTQDVSILQQRLLLLNTQWDELRHQVELRHQRVDERLSRWNVFSDKYRELMDWMTKMDQKISTGKDYHIEDFLAKLEQEYKTELQNIDQERERLVQDGQRLMRASGEIRANDTEYKLSKINDKWMRLKDKALARQKKLQETLSVVQQLEQNMRRLRQWLAQIEHQLGSPLVYKSPDFNEIQDCLQRQQELQREIQKHSTGVASVSNLCEVLLRDTDACPTAVEQTAIQQAIQSLDRRWKNICNLSMDRRQRIEETWRMWQKFHDEHQRMTDWLRDAERLVENPRTEHASFVTFKAELRKYENFQKSLHDKLQLLEHLNKQYRRMAREGRTDTNGELKHQVQSVNKRWDELSKHTQSVLRRLKHLVNVREDFTATREALMIWLSELNSRVTQLEHFSQADLVDKLQEVKKIQDEIKQNSHRLEYIDKASDYLIQKCESRDAVIIQREVDEFRQIVDDTVTRLNKYQKRLDKVSSGEPHVSSAISLEGHSPTSQPTNIHHSTPHGLTSGSLRPAPASNLDWDLEDGLDISALDTRPEIDRLGGRADCWDGAGDATGKYQKIRDKVCGRGDKLLRVEGYLRELEHALQNVSEHLRLSEAKLRAPTPVGYEASIATGSYTTLLSSCQNSIDQLVRLEKQLKQETGLPSLYGAEAQIRGVVKRWHSLQHAAIEKDHQLESNRQQWLQFSDDLNAMLSWLDDAEATQRQQLGSPSDIRQLEAAVHRHKAFLEDVDTRRPTVLILNKLSKDLLSGASSERRQLYDKLTSMNQRWDRVCALAAVWQNELQIDLVQCDDFNQTLDDLFRWLQSIESDIRLQEPVDFGASRDRLMIKYRKFRELKYDLERGQEKVLSLQDTTNSLMMDHDSHDSVSARERLHMISSQLKSLLKICMTYMSRIEGVCHLDTDSIHSHRSPYSTSIHGHDTSRFSTASALSPRSPHSYFSRQFVAMAPAGTFNVDPDQEIDETIEPSAAAPVGATQQQRTTFFSRVCRLALPIQGLMLLLLSVASLVPMGEDDYSCTLANNFRSSLDPMLQYTEGPPPF